MEDLRKIKIEIGMSVTAYKSQCIGLIIDSSTFTGKIIKVNKKSIRVQLEHIVAKHGDKVIRDTEYPATVTYKFWKTTEDGRIIYKSDSKIYGIIEFKEETETTVEETEEQTETTETTEITETTEDTAEQSETAESITKQYECENVVQVAHKVAGLTNTCLDRQVWKRYCDEVKKEGSSWFDYTAFDSSGNEFDVSIFLGYDQQCRHYFVSVDYEKCPVPDMSIEG